MKSLGLWCVACLFISNAAFAQIPDASPAPPPAPPPTYEATPAPAPAPTVVMAAPTIPEAPPRVEQPPHDVSFTFSPLHLLFPAFVATLEVRVDDQIGVAVSGGIGQYNLKLSDGSRNKTFVTWLGGSFRYYVTGNFDGGVQLGAQVMWITLSLDNATSSRDVTAVGDGVGVGPMIGYKHVSQIGFTFDGQIGVQYIFATATARDTTTTTTSTKSASGVGLLLNLNIGWSF